MRMRFKLSCDRGSSGPPSPGGTGETGVPAAGGGNVRFLLGLKLKVLRDVADFGESSSPRWRRGRVMETSGKNQRSVSERLKATTDELQKLEQLVVGGDCSPRVLADFRGVVDSIRQTAWAVQQWIELQRQQRDPYTVLGLLTEERVKRATQLTRDLTIDLQSLELDLETAGLEKLFQATNGLFELLVPLFRKKEI